MKKLASTEVGQGVIELLVAVILLVLLIWVVFAVVD